jgi:hypothetical protein
LLEQLLCLGLMQTRVIAAREGSERGLGLSAAAQPCEHHATIEARFE